MVCLFSMIYQLSAGKRADLPNEKDRGLLDEFILLSSRLEIDISPSGQSVTSRGRA